MPYRCCILMALRKRKGGTLLPMLTSAQHMPFGTAALRPQDVAHEAFDVPSGNTREREVNVGNNVPPLTSARPPLISKAICRGRSEAPSGTGQSGIDFHRLRNDL